MEYIIHSSFIVWIVALVIWYNRLCKDTTSNVVSFIAAVFFAPLYIVYAVVSWLFFSKSARKQQQQLGKKVKKTFSGSKPKKSKKPKSLGFFKKLKKSGKKGGKKVSKK